MASDGIYWIEAPELPGRMAIVRRPQGQDRLSADLERYRRAGLDVIVSMLEADEAAQIGLTEQARVCRDLGLSFFSFPIADFSVPPSIDATVALIDDLSRELAAGRGIGFHCLASRGRSPTIAACLMVHGGLSVTDAIARLTRARGLQVPETDAQFGWIRSFAAHIRAA